MKQTVKLILLVLVFCGDYLAKAQEQEEISDLQSGVESPTSPDVDEQNGTSQPSDGTRVGRIIGGDLTNSTTYPYAALLVAQQGVKLTTMAGVIISNTQILTSATTLKSAGGITAMVIRVGAGLKQDTGNNFKYLSNALNSGYNPTTLENDVAIVTINGTFAGQPNVQPIAMATTEIPVSTTNRPKCVVLGWNPNIATRDFLHQAEYELLTDQECTAAFNQTLPPSILCAKPVKGYACNTDGGAPLICNNQVYGVHIAQTVCSTSTTAVPPSAQKFAKLPIIFPPAAPRKNYVSCS